MRIINRYILKEHLGPFVFALSALTSLLLLQYIARKFGDLVGRGLSWQVIGEFFLLSIPFTVAMTLPMAVLVAVLYAFSRLAAENEVTALKAGGVSARGLMKPALVAATFLALFMLWFNDQLLPRANHELAALQMAIFKTKPTFALKPQVLNIVKEGQLYLRAGDIAADRTGHMTDVTIYDVSDATKRRTIYADSGTLSFAENRRDLSMRLYDGMMMSAPSDKPQQLNRIYYKQDVLRIRDVANSFQAIDADTAMKGEREMSVCEMQKEYARATIKVHNARYDSLLLSWRLLDDAGHHSPQPVRAPPPKAGGIGELYCSLVKRYLKVPVAHAAEAPLAHATFAQDTTKLPPAKAPAPKPPLVATPPAVNTAPAPGPTPTPITNARPDTGLPSPAAIASAHTIELNDAKMRIDQARHEENRYAVEIQKKFSLAAACIVLVLVGAPIALRFPSGGVGLVFGVSFFIFAVYYVGLIGGEALSDRNFIPPFWAMWADNIIFSLIGLALMTRMGHEGVTSRGGGFSELLYKMRGWFYRSPVAETAN